MELESFTGNNLKERKCPCCESKEKSGIAVSIPGLERIVDPTYGKKSKVLWMILLVCCAIACTYLTLNRLIHFFNIPLATKVVVKRMDEVKFPAFTICSNKLQHGLKPAVTLLAKEKCVAQGRSDCEINIENIPFRDLNFTLDDVWKVHALTNIEINLSLGSAIDVKEHLSGNLTSDKFEFIPQNTYLGSCVVIRHIGTVPYLSSATSLKVTINEPDIDVEFEWQYFLIPHGQDYLTGFDYLINEFEVFPEGYVSKLKLHQENFQLKNISGQECYDEKEEARLLQECAYDFLRPKICRLPGLPDSFRECESVKDIPNQTYDEFYSILEELSQTCPTRSVCTESQYIIYIDSSLPPFNDKDLEKTVILIRMSDDTVDVVDEYIDYTFPALVSDLFAYWGFFLNLSALVFAEIFEHIVKSCRNFFKKTRKNT